MGSLALHCASALASFLQHAPPPPPPFFFILEVRVCERLENDLFPQLQKARWKFTFPEGENVGQMTAVVGKTNGAWITSCALAVREGMGGVLRVQSKMPGGHWSGKSDAVVMMVQKLWERQGFLRAMSSYWINSVVSIKTNML